MTAVPAAWLLFVHITTFYGASVATNTTVMEVRSEATCKRVGTAIAHALNNPSRAVTFVCEVK